MPKKKTDEPEGPKPITLHTCALTSEQAVKLRVLLTERGWRFEERPFSYTATVRRSFCAK